MVYTVVFTSRFKKSLKRVKQFVGYKEARLVHVITLLAQGESLPQQFHDHALSGDMAGYRECHLAPDILLVYKVQEDIFLCSLTDIGKHAQLFR